MVQDVGQKKDCIFEKIERMGEMAFTGNIKRAVITGATGGIGREVCKYLASNGYAIYAACRNISKGEELRASLPDGKRELLHLIELDLTSFDSTEKFCKEIIQRLKGKKIDLLINNAGMIARNYTITPDGYEISMQVNYISVKKITEALLPYIEGKIINTVSCTIHSANIKRAVSKLNKAVVTNAGSAISKKQNTIKSLLSYSDSKLMLALYTIGLHKKRGSKIEVYGADPGIVNTGIISMHRWYDFLADIIFRPFIKAPARGALPIINAIEYISDSKNQTDVPLLFMSGKTKFFPKRIFREYGRGSNHL